MRLGEKIYKLRTEKNLSQGELADALEVSRQSVSKWETDASVPELDKLIKLSEIFGVSLDELVLDKKQPEETPPPEPKVVYEPRMERSSVRKTVGVILLCFAALVWLLVSLFSDIISGLILASPFVGCGLVCLLARKNAGLWCAWVVYLFVDIYLRLATGINRSYILYPQAYTLQMTVHLILAWSLLAVFVTLTVITVLRMRKAYIISLRKDTIGTAVSWFVYLLTGGSYQLIRFLFLPQINDRPYALAFSFVSSLFGWIRAAILVVALVFTVRLLSALFKKQ